MSQNQGQAISGTQNPRPASNPQYSALNTEPSARKLRSSDDTLNAYVETMLKNNKIVSFLHNFRTKVAKAYTPISTIALAVVFFFANMAQTEKNCPESISKWCYYGFIYFSIMTVFEMARLFLDMYGIRTVNDFFNDPKFKPLLPLLNGVDFFSNIGINYNILQAFLEKEQCPVLSTYLTWWAVLEFIPFVSLIITFMLTIFTMITYMHAEKKRLD